MLGDQIKYEAAAVTQAAGGERGEIGGWGVYGLRRRARTQ